MVLFFLIFALASLFIGGMFLVVYRRKCAEQDAWDRSVTAEAWARLADTGSRTEYDYDNRAHTVYFGIYEYDTADGQHVSAASDFGYGNLKDVPGTQGRAVKIRYNLKQPTECYLPEERAVAETVWPKFRKIGLFLLVLGVLFLTAAAAAWLGVFRPITEALSSQA